jgi:hypothetical protein
MEPLRFEEYEELLRKAGVQRNPDGTLVFDQAVADDAAAELLEDGADRCAWPPACARRSAPTGRVPTQATSC